MVMSVVMTVSMLPLSALAQDTPHTHSDDCYEAYLTCGVEEGAVHAHDDSCYTVEYHTVCGLVETEGHTHTDECYKTEDVLTCKQEETEGHTHSGDCWDKVPYLSCTDESDEHTHGDGCYDQRDELVCGKTEKAAHAHGEGCYESEKVLKCTQQVEPHTHEEKCWKEDSELICKKSTEPHVHTDECYGKKLICEFAEGNHDGEENPETALTVLLSSEKEKAVLGETVDVALTISGGKAPYTVVLNGEEQEPAEAGTHTYFLTPAEVGTFTVTAQVTDAQEESKEAELSVEVTEAQETDPAAAWLAKAKAVSLTGDWRKDLVAVAASQVGYTVADGECIYGDAGSDWSSAFVAWCLGIANIGENDFPRAASAAGLKAAMESCGVYHAAAEAAPNAGDLVFLDTDGNGSADRVAIVSAADDAVIQVIVGTEESVARGSFALTNAQVLGYASAQELMVRAGKLQPAKNPAKAAPKKPAAISREMAEEMAEELEILKTEDAELYAMVIAALEEMIGGEVTDLVDALSSLTEAQVQQLFMNAQGDTGSLLGTPINLNNHQNKSFYLEYQTDDGWTLLNDQTLKGDEPLRLNVNFSEVDALDLQSADYTMTYTADDILSVEGMTGDIMSNGIKVGHVSVAKNADGHAVATVTFTPEWVDVQVKKDGAGNPIRGGHIEGDFRMTGTLNMDKITEDKPSAIVIGGITVHYDKIEDLPAAGSDVHVNKPAPTLRKVTNTDGTVDYFLDYTVTVTAGAFKVPDVSVVDYFTLNGDKIDSHTDGSKNYGYDYANATQTSNTKTGLGAPTLANAATTPDGASVPYAVKWTIGDMDAGEVRTLNYSVKLTANTIGYKETPSIKNKATVYAKNYERDDAESEYRAQAGATVDKSHTDPVKGEDGNYYIDYTVTVRANQSNTYDLTNIILRDVFGDRTQDALEPYIHYLHDDTHKIEVTYPDGTKQELPKPAENAKLITTTIPRLAAGQTATLRYTMKVDAAVSSAANGNIQIGNRAQAWDNSQNGNLATSPYFDFHDSDVTIDSKQWSQKVAGTSALASPQTITASGELYDATGSGIQKMASTSETFTVPAGSFRYDLTVNEAGDYGIAALNMRDVLQPSGGVHYQSYAGFVRVDAYTIPGNTLAKTVWVKVDNLTEFSYKPQDIGLTDAEHPDAKYALRMTYYAKPQNNNNIVRVTAGNSFSINGTVIGPDGKPLVLANMSQNVNVTVSGGQEYKVSKEGWYYDLNPTPNFENGTLYWAIKIDTKQLKQGLVIQDSANIGSSTHWAPNGETMGQEHPTERALLGIYRLNTDGRPLKEVYSSFSELPADKAINIDQYCDVTYSTSGGGKNKDMNFRFKETMTLEGEESLYIILRTTPGFTVPDRNSHTFTNKLNLSYNDGSSWDNTHPQDTITIPASSGIMKETWTQFVRKTDGSIHWLIDQRKDAGKIGREYLEGNNLTGVFVSWVVKVNYTGTLAGDYTVIDQIPDGLEPVFARNKWVGQGYNNANAPQLSQITDSDGFTEKTITSGTDNGVTRTSYFYINGQQLKFKVSGLHAGNANDQYSVDIQIMCRVKDQNVLSSGLAKNFHNVAELYNKDGLMVDRATSAQTVQAPSVSKNGNYAAGMGGLYPFELKLNEGASDLVQGTDEVVLIDEMEGPMTFLPETLTVTWNDAGTNKILPAAEYKISVETSSKVEGGKTIPVTILKITLPDNKALTVNYKCMINAKPDTPVSIFNKAHWEGQPAPSGGTVSKPNFSYTAEGTVSSSQTPDIKVTKVDGADYSRRLPGAEFTIAPTKLENGKWVADTSNAALVHTHVTNADGTFTCTALSDESTKNPNHFKYNTVYAIKESQAPGGYIPDETWRYWMVLKKDGQGQFPAVPEGVEAYVNGYEFPMTVYNYQYSALVEKAFAGTPVNGTYTFGIWENAQATGTQAAPPVTIRYPTVTQGEFSGLSPDKTYYIFELDGAGNPILPAASTDMVATINSHMFKVSYSGGNGSAANAVTVTGQTVGGAKPKVTVTNAPAVTDISVVKSWNDNNNQDGKRPSSITVTLKANGTATDKTLVLNAGNGWRGTFTDLNEYDSDNNLIVYTVAEEAVAGYEVTYSPIADGAITITNTHTPETVNVSGSKVWQNDTGNEITYPDIKIHLHANGEAVVPAKVLTVNGSAEKTETSGIGETEGWQWTFTNLPKYENGKQINYTFAEEKLSDFTTSYLPSGTIINRYTPNMVSVPVEKHWDDHDDAFGLRPEFVTIALYKRVNGADVDTGKRLTLDAANNWEGSFVNLPKNEVGSTVAIVYSVKEVLPVPHYTHNPAADVQLDDGIYEITNHVIDEKVTVAGKKTWVDTDAANRPASIKIHLHVDGEHPEPREDYIREVTPDAQGNWTWHFENLPKYANGHEIVYTIAEEAVQDYTTSIHGYDVTNTYNPGKITIEVIKGWEDNNNQDGLRPASVTVNLLANGQPTGRTLVLNEGNNWQGEFDDLIEYYAGVKIAYTVSEEAVNGYTPSYGVNGNILTIINSHTPETRDVIGSKTWVGGTEVRPQSITIHLHANGEHKLTKTVTEEDGWKWAFTGLPRYENGQEIVYTIVETAVPDFTTTVNGFNVTNTYNTGKTNITVSKVWLDHQNQDGKRPISVEVKLLRKLATAEDWETEPVKTMTLTAGSLWVGTFTDLPLKDTQTGKDYRYTVVETPVAGYDSTVEGTAAEGFTLTNTHTPETVTVSGAKTWADENNKTGNRPAQIIVELYANGAKKATKTVTANEQWSWEFTDLPKYEAGEEITYTIGEVAIENYETAIQGYNITNTYTTEHKVQVRVNKVWEDNHNQDGKRPNSVTVHLLADGVDTHLTKELNAANNWQETFTDLEEYREGEVGQKIVYTITEDAVHDYTTVITGSAAEGFVVTNSHTPERINVQGKKTWVNNTDVTEVPYPATITIHIHAGNTHIESKVVTAADGWKWSFTNMPKYANGEEIVYTIREEAVRDFTTTVSGYDVTNEYTPDYTSLRVAKVWEDANDQDGLRPASITIRLLQNGVPMYGDGKTLTLDASNGWAGTFTGLLKHIPGTVTDYVYTVREEATPIALPMAEGGAGAAPQGDTPIPFYTTEITGSMLLGYTVINTHVPQTTSISGSKTWNDDNNRDGKRPESIRVQLRANGLVERTQTVTPNADGVWEWNFENLPEYRNGVRIVYTVTEEAVEGYTFEADYNEQNKTYNLTNSYTPGKVSIAVAKNWNDSDNQDGIRPASVSVNLLADGVAVPGKTLTLNEANHWSGTFSNLDEYLEGQVGHKIEYTISEVAVSGYTTTYSGSAVTGFAITNTHTPEKVSVSVTKVWDDMNDHDGVRPESVKVWLKADGVRTTTFAVLNADNQWRHTFSDLDKYKAGTAITYTVEEEKVTGYTAAVSGSAATAFVITNSHTVEKVGNLKISKTVLGDLGSKTKEFTFTVTLGCAGEYPYTGSKTGTITSGGTVKLKHGESITITGLPAGVAYTVTESDNAGYVVNATNAKGTIDQNKTVAAIFVNSKSSVPKTGDQSNFIQWVTTMIVCLLGAAAALFFLLKRRSRYHN